jgi:hypothetical protein
MCRDCRQRKAAKLTNQNRSISLFILGVIAALVCFEKPAAARFGAIDREIGRGCKSH